MDKVFLSQNNYGLLHEIIKTTIMNRYEYDIDEHREANFLNKLLNIMKQIFEDRSKFNLPEDMNLVDKIKQLNKYTLDFIIPHFSKIVQHSIQNKKQEPVQIHPKISNYAERNTIHTRMISNDNNFNVMSNDNSQLLNPEKPDSIDFSLPIDNSSFPMDKFNEMQKARENELKQLETEKKKKENPQPKVNKNEEEITPSGIINQKNMIEQASDMISFEKMNSMKEDRDRKFEQKLAELAKERDVVFKKSLPEPNGSDSAINVEAVEEFKADKTFLEERNDGVFMKNTLPENPTELFKPDPSIEKQFLERSTKNDIIKEDDLMIKQPVDTNVYTEYITIDSRDDLKLNQPSGPTGTESKFTVYFPWKRFKNIKEITMTSARIPFESQPSVSPGSKIEDEPYLLVSIDELGGSLYNSNNKNIKYFSKIYNGYNGHTFGGVLQTLTYDVDMTTKAYNIHNLSSLEKMTLSITDFRGNLFSGMTLSSSNKKCFSFTFQVDYTIGDANEHINSNMV